MIFPLKMVIFHSYVSLPEGNYKTPVTKQWLSQGDDTKESKKMENASDIAKGALPEEEVLKPWFSLLNFRGFLSSSLLAS